MSSLDSVRVNILPTPTWHRLHVNDANISVPSSTIPLPILDNATSDPVVSAGARIFPEGVSFHTGMGPEYDAYLQKQTLPICFTIAENQTSHADWLISCDEVKNGAASMEIYAEAGSDLTLYQYITGSADTTVEQLICALQTKLYLQPGAHIKLVQIQTVESPFLFLNDVGAICQENAHFELVQLFLGGAETYTGCQTDLAGTSSRFDAAIGYYAQGSRLIDCNYTATHIAQHTQSNMNAYGVLDHQAQKVFRGTIDFKRGSAGSVGGETEDVLMLGSKVVNRTIPLILCAEEDVQGSHGASIGQPDEETLFYLCTRGISMEDAYRLLARSKMDTVCRLLDTEAQQRVGQYLAEVMGFDGEEL